MLINSDHFILHLLNHFSGCSQKHKTNVELSKVSALNEIFTSNTTLCIAIKDQTFISIFDEISNLTQISESENSAEQPQFLVAVKYFEMLENILDLEESNQILYLQQSIILRLLRDYWEVCNGRTNTVEGDIKPLNILHFREDKISHHSCMSKKSWKNLYLTKVISLMSSCVIGEPVSSITICKVVDGYRQILVVYHRFYYVLF